MMHVDGDRFSFLVSPIRHVADYFGQWPVTMATFADASIQWVLQVSSNHPQS